MTTHDDARGVDKDAIFEEEMEPGQFYDLVMNPLRRGRQTFSHRKYKTAKALGKKADQYIHACLKGNVPITVTGLVVYLGFATRKSLNDYQTMSPEYAFEVKRALLLVERAYEMRLHGKSPAGAMFALKQMGWKDTSDVNHLSPDGSMSPKSPATINIVGVGEDGEDVDE